ncbi:FkbM family methyltransferase [Microbaculum marinum]|uniref:FkbM family methyltransferase n=1 Tax=Microbaculum marinum TaxID=1764581 RepID=A0AAW9RWU1_9HYPH
MHAGSKDIQEGVAELNRIFDDPATRDKPLKEREPITKILEETLYEIIDIADPGIFVEVGAFEGSFSKQMKAKYPDRPVIALEANPRVYAHFFEDLNAADVSYHNLAASSSNGPMKMYIPTVIAGKEMPKIGRMGSLLQVGLRDSETTEVMVSAVTLDQFLAGKDLKGGCFWIDVEGALDQVLAGARNALKDAAIVYAEIEIAPVWKEQALSQSVIDTLATIGLELAARDCQKWFQYNALFLNKSLQEDPRVQDLLTRFYENGLSIFKS